MKSVYLKARILATFLVSIIIMSGCGSNSDTSGGTIETTNGIVAGTVVATDLKQNEVKLIPEDFDPTIDSEDLILKDTTDINGKFEFNNVLPGIYNLEINSQLENKKAFIRAIESDGNKNEFDSVAILQTGSLIISEIPDSFPATGEFYMVGTTRKWVKSEVANNSTVLFSNLPASILPEIQFKTTSGKSLKLTSEVNIGSNETDTIPAFSFYTELKATLTPLPSNKITALSLDYRKRVIIGTEDSGYSINSLAGWDSFHIGNSELTSNFITSINPIVTDTGDTAIWMGTKDGLIKRVADSEVMYKSGLTGLSSNNIRSIVGDKAIGVWIGTDDGLVHFDGTSWSKQTNMLLSNDIASCLNDKYRRLWVANSTGLAYSNGLTWTQVSTTPTSVLSEIGNKVFVGHENGSITSFDSTLSSTSYNVFSSPINCIFEASDGIVYSATNEGISLFDGVKWSDTNPNIFKILDGKQIVSIIEGYKGNLWFGTKNSGIIIVGPNPL